jgi:hypothetical protein
MPMYWFFFVAVQLGLWAVFLYMAARDAESLKGMRRELAELRRLLALLDERTAPPSRKE